MSDPPPTFDIPKEGWAAVVVRGQLLTLWLPKADLQHRKMKGPTSTSRLRKFPYQRLVSGFLLSFLDDAHET